jgi:uncharacterized protein YbjT (DUF2867 family)
MLLITGGTGFVGGYILEALEGKRPRSEVRVLARAGAELERLRAQGYQMAEGSVTNADEVRRAMQGVDEVIHLVAIIREAPKQGQTFDRVMGEGTENVARAAQEAGAKRLLFMSALGSTNASTPYYRNKLRGETAVKATGIPYTIFRPSFLIGPGGEFTGLLKTLTMFPLVPVLGGGRFPVQPMYVRDIARYYVQALDDERFANQTFEVGGPQVISFKEMMRQTLQVRGKKALLVNVPLFLVRPFIPIVDRLLPKLITRDQFTMLLEGSATREHGLEQLGGFELTSFGRALEIAFTTPPPPTSAKAKVRPGEAHT